MPMLPRARLVFGLTNIVGAAIITAGAWLLAGTAVGLITWGALILVVNFAEVLLIGRR